MFKYTLTGFINWQPFKREFSNALEIDQFLNELKIKNNDLVLSGKDSQLELENIEITVKAI